ncbi:FctA domain-containing protein, partial [Escherichia coli]
GLHFTNTYTIPDETSIQITASKTYNGGELDAGEFVFRLSGAGDQLIEEKKNAADGSVTFMPLAITQEGTYRYTLAEVAGKAEGVTYDTRVYTLTYEVTVDDQNRLQAVLSEVKQDGGILPTDAKLVFENTYTAP